MFKGFYINLDRNPARRERFEENLRRIVATARYERFAAIDGAAAMQSAGETKLSPGALGCWMSHVQILRENLDSDRHLHIAEDDALLPPDFVPSLDAILQATDNSAPDWDMLFTEIFVPVSQDVFDDFAARLASYRKNRSVSVTSLSRVGFAATSSYAVNRQSIGKLLVFLDGKWNGEKPIDLFLRELVKSGRIKALLTVPFLSTLSPDAEHSDVQSAKDRSRRAMNLFRSAFYRHADVDAIAKQIAELTLAAKPDPLHAIFADMVRFIYSDYEKF
jgi:GR25 family glycosyltransferase involved in LPS biosynthesis